MRSWKSAVLAAALGLVAGTASCGSEKDKCPGITCTNCSGSGDCTITCPAGRTQVCESLGNYGGDSNLRCAWCR
jgi:hypothetical protein